MMLVFRLSTYLYAATKNDTYKQAAELSAEFSKNLLFNGTVIIDRINVSNCAKVAHEAGTYLAGLAIEGLSAYVNVTGNNTWSQ